MKQIQSEDNIIIIIQLILVQCCFNSIEKQCQCCKVQQCQCCKVHQVHFNY